MTRLTAISPRLVTGPKPERRKPHIRSSTRGQAGIPAGAFQLEARMAYDRYDPERGWRDDRPDFSERGPRGWDRGDDRDRDFRGRENRGFFERMGDEVRSWFDDEDRGRPERDSDWDDRGERSRFGEPRRQMGDYGRDDDRDRGYRPMAGDYGRAGNWDVERHDSQWARDPYRRTSLAGSRLRSNDDRHYEDMRRRQAEDLDRDYDEYRRERASQFESDFGSWRERRMSKREMLRDIREHMEVVGSDDKHVGTVDRVAGDRIILTRSDPQSGGVHHSLSCSDLDRVEGDRIILECSSEKARERWRDEDRERALFEREDQGSAGPHMLDRSFSGTYR